MVDNFSSKFFAKFNHKTYSVSAYPCTIDSFWNLYLKNKAVVKLFSVAILAGWHPPSFLDFTPAQMPRGQQPSPRCEPA